MMMINEGSGGKAKNPDFGLGDSELQKESFTGYKSIIKAYYELGREDLYSADKPRLLQLANSVSSEEMVCPEHTRGYIKGWLAYELGDISEREGSPAEASEYFDAAIDSWKVSPPETHDVHLWLGYAQAITMLRIGVLKAKLLANSQPSILETRVNTGRLAFDGYQLAQQQVESRYRGVIRKKATELLAAAVILKISEHQPGIALMPFPTTPRQNNGEHWRKNLATPKRRSKKTSRDLVVQMYSDKWEPGPRIPVQIKNNALSNDRGNHDQNVIPVIYCQDDLGVRTDQEFREMAMALTHHEPDSLQGEKIKRAQQKVLTKLGL